MHFIEMSIISILISTAMVAISTKACRVGCLNPFTRLLIDIEESEAKGKFCFFVIHDIQIHYSKEQKDVSKNLRWVYF